MLFKNILLAVDVDGTLLNDEAVIPDNNVRAINEFREGGGLFTIATGRATSYSRNIALELDIDIPTIVYNGAMVYDFKNEKKLWQCVLPHKAREYLSHIIQRYPTLGVDVLYDDDIYSISTNYQHDKHKRMIGTPVIKCSMADLPDVCFNKMLLIDESDVIDSLYEYSFELDLEGVNITRSSPHFFEILPDNANKGLGLEKIVELCGFEDYYIVTAGDYINDIEMIRVADLGVAVENALDEVKAVADIVVCDNNGGAIYEVVEYLKSGRKKS